MRNYYYWKFWTSTFTPLPYSASLIGTESYCQLCNVVIGLKLQYFRKPPINQNSYSVTHLPYDSSWIDSFSPNRPQGDYFCSPLYYCQGWSLFPNTHPHPSMLVLPSFSICFKMLLSIRNNFSFFLEFRP